MSGEDIVSFKYKIKWMFGEDMVSFKYEIKWMFGEDIVSFKYERVSNTDKIQILVNA